MTHIIRTFLSLMAVSFVSFSAHKIYALKAIETFPQRLERIAKEINTSNLTWKANEDVSRFEGQTFHSIKSWAPLVFKNSLNLDSINEPQPLFPLPKEELEQMEKWYEEANPESDVELPKSFDAREKWSNCSSIQEIRDQSQCGSCWAVSSASVMSDRICIHSENQSNQKRVSSTDIYSCCENCVNAADHEDMGGCFGADPFLAMKEWKNQGWVTGDDYGSTNTCKPYYFPPCAHHVEVKGMEPCMTLLEELPNHDGYFNTPKCKRHCEASYDGKYWSDKTFGKSYYRLGTVERMKRDLVRNGPQVVSLTVCEDLFVYKSGVYKHSPTVTCLGGHAVRLIGYGTDEETGEDYWTITNSWNKYWGDNGSFKILRGVNMVGIESAAQTVLPEY